jgi:hypothetical protein
VETTEMPEMPEMPEMKSERHHDAQDFVRNDWTDLVRADPSGTFFQTPRYMKLYWEEFGDALHLHLTFVRDGERLAGAAAFEVMDGTVRFLGGTEVTDYLGPVAAEADRAGVARALLGLEHRPILPDRPPDQAGAGTRWVRTSRRRDIDGPGVHACGARNIRAGLLDAGTVRRRGYLTTAIRHFVDEYLTK